GRFAPPSQKVQVDVRLDEIVLHTLEKEPGRRYQHVSDVKTDVERVGHGPASKKAGPIYHIVGALLNGGLLLFLYLQWNYANAGTFGQMYQGFYLVLAISF